MNTQQQKQYKILLVGDSCQDIYHYGVCERLSPEAPVPILKEKSVEIKFGMAHNVKNNLASFEELNVDFITNKEIIKKHRFVDEKTKSHLLRVDEGESSIISPLSLDKITNDYYDMLIISDYNKGFLTYDICKSLTEKFKDIPIFVDTKKEDLGCFRNSIIKLNEKEYLSHKNLHKTSKIISTLGDRGAMFENIFFPTKKVDVYDVCGAGDVFLSCLAFKYLKTLDIKHSINFANKAASFSVTKFGTYVLTKKDFDEICD